jgi:hypothetical protein
LNLPLQDPVMLATSKIVWRPYVLCFLILYCIYKIESTWSLESLKISLLQHPPRRQARNISATELLSRPLATDITSIPKILHQSWKSKDLPFKFQQWSEGCRIKHPDWEWVLWTDDDNLNLVRQYYPWLEKTYRALPAGIYRADLVRSLCMYTFGGYVVLLCRGALSFQSLREFPHVLTDEKCLRRPRYRLSPAL